MDFEGRVIQFLGETSGTSKAGNLWKKKEWVVETFGQYPKKIKIQCFGDRADSINLIEGNSYVLSVDLESREYNGRWYTDVSVFRVQNRPDNGPQDYNGGNFTNQQMPGQGNFNSPYGVSDSGGSSGFIPSSDDGDEDLPF